jgi:hypothetical protein
MFTPIRPNHVRIVLLRSFSSPSGGRIMALQSHGATFRVGRRAQKRRSAEADLRIGSSPQAAFLAFGGVAFAAGFGASLAFSFAANSCLTLRLIASTSTL